MSLYDDEDVASLPEPAVVTGWSKSVNWMQSQQKQTLATKKAAAAAAAASSPAALGSANRGGGGVRGGGGLLGGTIGAERPSPAAVSLPPVINLLKSGRKAREVGQDEVPRFSYGDKIRGDKSLLSLKDPNWTVVNEYDPQWPNDYHKVVQDMKDTKGADDENLDSKKRRYTEAGRERARERFRRDDPNGGPSPGSSATGTAATPSGFSRRPNEEYSDHEDDEDDRRGSRRRRSDRDGGGGGGGGDRNSRQFGSPYPSSSSSSAMGGGGAAIAPPPSLTESSEVIAGDKGDMSSSSSPPSTMSMVQKLASMPATGLGVAAKIMARYGYKHGQGLGRSEQGMSQALSVEKTSKRGGRIVHEKDLMPPPPLFGETSTTPPHVALAAAAARQEEEAAAPGDKPSITDLMKNPGKVVMCKNMVGPGEVDSDLEPEVKEECHTKYGDVNKVVIFELANVVPEEAVRIFIEFKRVESAIKAVVDLNGRFFGGREVTATFYDLDKFQNLQLTD